MKIVYGLLATTALFASISATYAETPDRNEIVVTAARAERPLSETGNSITVIDQKEIETRQSVAVIDLLRNVPGVTFASNGGIGSVTSVFIRGASSEHTVALIDGVKLNDPSTPAGGFDFGNLLVGNIARIEVVRGSQSVLWGSQAIGGVVNMITRQPTEKLAVNARAEGGWHDTERLVANVSGKFGPVAASVGGGYFHTDGYSAYDANMGGTERDGYRNYGGNASFNIALSDAISVDLRGWYSNGKNDFDAVYIPADSLEYSKTREFIGYSGLNAALLDGRWTNRFAYARTQVDRDYFDPDSLPVKWFDGQGTNDRFEYQGAFKISDAWTADFGAETEKSEYSLSYYGAPADIADARLTSFYGQLTVKPIKGLTLATGVRHDHHDRFGDHTSFAANGVFSLNDGATLVRASYGEGFKAPSLYQLYDGYSGNLNLRPENSRSWDAGITQKFIDGKAEISATWFHRDTDNLIDWDSATYTYNNISKARAKGLETSLILRPVEALTFQAGYSWIDAENRTTGLQLARRPRHSANASIDYRWPFKLETGATITHVGDSFNDAYNSRRLDGYVVVDLRASYPIIKGVELFGRVENLFNERYETAYRYGTQPRAAYAGIRLSL